MKSIAQHALDPVRRFALASFVKAVAIVILSLQMNYTYAEEMKVPLGFKRLPGGEIMVDDPVVAIPPEGYRISEKGVLVKEAPVTTAETAVEGTAEGSVEKPAAAEATDTEITEIPPGFHRMPNGDVMANNPSTAVAPPGYRLTESGILKKADDMSPDKPKAVPVKADEFDEIPPGYHRMPDGTLMANSPSTAVAPEGYHLMPDGTLMRESDVGSVDHAAMGHHGKGGMLMAEYRFVRMYMDGMLDTTKEVSAKEAVDPGGDYGYMMAPTDMTMDMHMVMLMYHSTKYMLMAMFHYMENDMGMLSSDGTKSDMQSGGIADTVITATITGPNRISFLIGVSVPTGSINERGPMTHSADFTEDDVKYPYGMQLGSGTYDLIQGFSYQNTTGKMNWGVGYEYTYRFQENKYDYTLGDVLLVNGWSTWNFSNTVSATGKLQWRDVHQIEGADPELEARKNMSPSMDADNYGGRRMDLGVGIKYENAQMTSLSADLTMPVYQNLFGPQMKTEWLLGVTFGYMF